MRKRFGALAALDGVDLEIGPGDAIGIVGPNGAGKTTLLNVLAGTSAPSSGTIRFKGREVTRMRAAGRARLGIGRAHQIPRPFSGMTVFENCYVGASVGGRMRRRAAYSRCLAVLDLCQLTDVANRRAETLGLLDRKRLEMARALATNPELLLLDEIGAGLTDAEAAELVVMINQLHRHDGIAVVWIEHIVHVLVQVVTRLICGVDVLAAGDRRRRAGRRDERRPRGRRLPRNDGRMTLLEVDSLELRHGLLEAVRGVSLSVKEGEVVALVGANGAGKTTLLRGIAGAHRAVAGRIAFDGTDVTRVSAFERARMGIALVPEGRRLFANMTVEENLQVAEMRVRPGRWNVESVLEALPLLAPLRRQRAATLSGGEQQATAIGRALVTNPRLLLLDEVSLGLAPVAVDAVYASLRSVIGEGMTVVLVDQDFTRVGGIASRVVCMLEGRFVLEGESSELTREQITEAYFGLRGGRATAA